ncbi:MAG: phosphomannomutase CpsG [Candidatus Accumulibacter sp.]|nr:phosphomannomutase CpsG [Accumulibacter sp.]
MTCFKAYDIRGRLGAELDEDIARRIGRAYGEYFRPRRVAVGGDARRTSAALKQALAEGLMDAGADVLDLGLTGAEEIYFAAFHLDVDGGIEVTASHNPLDYNGMKLVGKGARPVSGDSGLREIRRLAEENSFPPAAKRGVLTRQAILDPYVDHLLSYVDPSGLKPLQLLVDSGNGAAGHVVDAIERRFQALPLPVDFVKIHHHPDPAFPNGIPNPLLPENRTATAEAVRTCRADLGIAWDGDFDRCFLFDETGRFIEGYYIVGLLAQAFLRKNPGARVIHDPRLVWNTLDVVAKHGGVPVQSKTGHAFIKERMRSEDAIYGGEMSAHHYFRDFAYCDSGMIPWLLVIGLMSATGQPLSRLVGEREAAYPCSGEINYTVADAAAALRQVEEHFAAANPAIDRTDGLSLAFDAWRFNLRASNTEPLLRLNVESRGNAALVTAKVREIEEILGVTV